MPPALGRRRTADRTIDGIRERIGRKAVEYGVAVGLERGQGFDAARRVVFFPAFIGLPLRDCPMGRRAPPDFARYVPNHTRLIKTDDFQARSSTALEAAM